MNHPDVQALVYASFAQLRHCRYLLLRIDQPQAARHWLRQKDILDLIPGGDQVGGGQRRDEVLAVAFTHAGLVQLGFEAHPDFPFPSAFQEGMNQPERAHALGDGHVDAWRWGDVAAGPRAGVDMLVAHFRNIPFAAEGPLSAEALEQAGFGIVQLVSTCPAYIETRPGEATRAFEPFGFRDGLSQPVLQSVAERAGRRPGGATSTDNVVADGEFVLGLPNEYGDPAYAPDDRRWPASGKQGPGSRFGSHGSYLVVRHIRQHVERFAAFDALHPPARGGEPSLTERMVGRRKDGTPLVQLPEPVVEQGDFRFRVNDADGFQCPLGAHIRRANPRDSLGANLQAGLANAKRHRLIRRGRVYTEACALSDTKSCGEADGRRTCGQGLFFVALNADLDRQFEFVQQQWIANPKFAGLADESDPLLGGRGGAAFTVQTPSVKPRINNLPSFTEMVGGGYFFLPSLSALRFLAELEMPQGS